MSGDDAAVNIRLSSDMNEETRNMVLLSRQMMKKAFNSFGGHGV